MEDAIYPPIDIVITWVDGSDEKWLAQKRHYASLYSENAWTEWTMGEKRFRDWGLLPYWFRSVEKYATWVNKIYFVTCGQVPKWLNTANEKLVVINHKDFIPSKYLPTFNSHAIEWNLHRIKGLSEYFVYMNDDLFFNAPTSSSDFFKNGLPCDFATLNVSLLNRTRTAYGPYAAMILNDHFDKREVVNKHLSIWLNPKNGFRNNLKTLFLLPQKHFTGTLSDHLPMSMLKKTYREIWSVESNEIDRNCQDRFRGFYGISPNLIRDWQRAQGNISNRAFDYGISFDNPDFFKKDANLSLVLETIKNEKYKVICINDEIDDDAKYAYWGEQIKAAFDMKFPNKSSFELELS